MAAYNKFDVFTSDLVTKKHDFSSDVFKVMFTNTLPVRANSVKADISEIASSGGYSAGGVATTVTLSNVAGVETVFASPAVITASGAIGPFQYTVFYNSTPAAGLLVSWEDLGTPVTILSGITFTWTPDAINGLFTVT